MKTTIFIISLMFGIQTTVRSEEITPVHDPVAELEKPGGSKLINEWITVHLKTIRNGKTFSHHIRQLAYTGLAVYESVVPGDLNYQSLSGQLNGFKLLDMPSTPKEFCWQASANSAMATMFRFFYSDNPGDIIRFDSLEKACKERLIQEGFSEKEVLTGAQFGSSVARAFIEWSKSDGNDKINAAYAVPRGTGLWETTPPGFIPPIQPYLGNVRTIVKGSIDNTLPPPPIAFSTENGSPFYKMAEEVYLVSLELDETKKATGLFWDDLPNGKTLTSGGHWESILKTILTDLNLSLIEGVRLYSSLFITMNDAAIGCFKAKYTYNVIRPVTYIQKNMNHPEWNPLIITPPHPEYPAAHATVSMSAATILTHVLGDEISFTDDTYGYKGYKAHQFKNFRETGKEAGLSRFYGGIHYLPSIEAGNVQGEKIANNVYHALAFKK